MSAPTVGYPFTNPFADTQDGRAATLRLIRLTVVILFAAGGLMMAGVLLLPEPGLKEGTPRTIHLGLVVFMLTFALVTAAVRQVPDWWYLAAPAVGIVAVTVYICLLEELRPVPFFYVWPLLAGTYFAQRREVIAGFVFFVASYSAALTFFTDTSYKAEWFIDVVGSMAIVMWMVFVLKERAGRLVARLHGIARTDALTGVLNRGAFEEALDHHIAAARASGGPCAVISLDLDHFKQVNDVYGHAAGDAALRGVADIVNGTGASDAVFARVGGEEFALVLPGMGVDDARTLAERIRTEVEIGTAANEPALTVSAGVAAFPTAGPSASSVVLAADRALYAAKQAGRNRVVVAQAGADGMPGASDAERAHQADAQTALRLAERLDVHRYGDHHRSREVGALSGRIAETMGMPGDQVSRVRLAGIVRDVGMLGVPEELLVAAHALSPDERELMERHVRIGSEVLSACGLPEIGDWVAAHHEHPDGSGYPHGLTGAAIPLAARIIGVAEAYSSLTHGPGVAPRVALEELRSCAGAQFDERVVEALATVLSLREDASWMHAA